MELIDTHCHLTFEGLAENVENVILRSIEAGVTVWITVGTNLTESRKAVEMANKYEDMYAAFGIHPHYAKNSRVPSKLVTKWKHRSRLSHKGWRKNLFHKILQSCFCRVYSLKTDYIYVGTTTF